MKRGTQISVGSMSELATREVVPRQLAPFQVRLDGPGTPRGLGAALRWRSGPLLPRSAVGWCPGARCSGGWPKPNASCRMSAPAGSGKTVLLRSWIAEAGLAQRAAWVPVDGEERDPQRFWISVADALRGTAAGSALVRPLTAAPDLDGWAVVERLLKDLAPLAGPAVAGDRRRACAGLGRGAAPAGAAGAARAAGAAVRPRHPARPAAGAAPAAPGGGADRDPRGRPAVQPGRGAGAVRRGRGGAVRPARWPGCTSGPRAGRPGCGWPRCRWPGTRTRSGSPRSSPAASGRWPSTCWPRCWTGRARQVRRLLLRTSVLERVYGELADLLTGRLGRGADPAGSGAGRRVRGLAGRAAVVVPLPPAVRGPAAAGAAPHRAERAAPRCTGAAAGWLAEHGHPVEAVRHAQAAEDWGMAARLLSDHWLDLYLGGRGATLVDLLARFPCRVVAASPELTTVQVAGDLVRGSLEDAGRHLAQATARARRRCPRTAADACRSCWPCCGCSWPGASVDFPAVVEEAQRLLALTEAADAAHLGLGEDLRAAALISLGIAEIWALRFEDGGTASGAGRGPGAPDRAAVPGVHRPGPRGARDGRCSGPMRRKRSGAGRRSSWRNGTAGARSRSPGWPTPSSAS